MIAETAIQCGCDSERVCSRVCSKQICS